MCESIGHQSLWGHCPKGQILGLRGQISGLMKERTNRQMDKQKSPCVLQDFVPFGAAAQKKQLTRGYNIIADGWAGASNPHRHLNPNSNLHTTSSFFQLVNSITTEQWTNRPTDKDYYRVASPQLKMEGL